jgi:protein-S-isoprenylcysteine O-methyltransferase Ste14
MSHRAGLGAEHPLNDKIQVVFLIVFLGIWNLDSFVFRFSTVLAGAIPVLARTVLGLLSFVTGTYLAGKSHSVIFARTRAGGTGKPEFTTTGVYAWVRHPMYLGILLILLAFFLSTLSLLSLLAWAGLFVFYDRMATYEEQDLIRILGEKYVDYQKQVSKWIPHPRRKMKRHQPPRQPT